MISKELKEARKHEASEQNRVSTEMRPVYHLSPRIGWLNDPNGFSFYGGKYHLFYQYHPYSTYWGPMHWGHAVSDDFISWEYLPAALAPDKEYDRAGCFSGSALTLPDGRHLLMYTGCADDGKDPQALGRWRQSQNIATGDGKEYTKFDGNPVITEADLPEGGDAYEFRDPYIWKTEKGYRAVVANAGKPGAGTQLTMYSSSDGFRWKQERVLFEDTDRIGIMWECPNYFTLDGKQVLIASPMDMQAEEANGSVRFPKGNNVCYMTGDIQDDERFEPYRDEVFGKVIYNPVDWGLDFYAPQVMKTPDGRTVMVGWMQDPKTANTHDESGFRTFGQMTVPRELSIRDGLLVQSPVRELDTYIKNNFEYRELKVTEDELSLPGVQGRAADIRIRIMPDKRASSDEDDSLPKADSEKAVSYEEFRVRWAENERFYTELIYCPSTSVITIDRTHSGQDSSIPGKRSIRVSDRGGVLDLRILIDRWSAEVFINGGIQVMSLTYYTEPDARNITFSARGTLMMDVSGGCFPE